MSKLKVEFIDNSSSQYDENAAKIKIKGGDNNAKGKLYLGDRHAAAYVQLKFRNCTTVVNCSKEMHGFAREPDVNYLKIDPDEENNHFKEAYEFLESQLSKGKNVVVHCENGLNKSAAVMVYYVMKKCGVSLADSYRLVDKARGIKVSPALVSKLLAEEKNLRGSVSVALDGRKVVFLDALKATSTKAKRKADPYLPLYILGGVGGFFAAVFAVLVVVTGKL